MVLLHLLSHRFCFLFAFALKFAALFDEGLVGDARAIDGGNDGGGVVPHEFEVFLFFGSDQTLGATMEISYAFHDVEEYFDGVWERSDRHS